MSKKREVKAAKKLEEAPEMNEDSFISEGEESESNSEEIVYNQIIKKAAEKWVKISEKSEKVVKSALKKKE